MHHTLNENLKGSTNKRLIHHHQLSMSAKPILHNTERHPSIKPHAIPHPIPQRQAPDSPTPSPHPLSRLHLMIPLESRSLLITRWHPTRLLPRPTRSLTLLPPLPIGPALPLLLWLWSRSARGTISTPAWSLPQRLSTRLRRDIIIRDPRITVPAFGLGDGGVLVVRGFGVEGDYVPGVQQAGNVTQCAEEDVD